MNKALTWMKRWQPTGTTNMLKAIEVAIEYKSDCIYLFTDGKADKPVLVMSRGGKSYYLVTSYIVEHDNTQINGPFFISRCYAIFIDVSFGISEFHNFKLINIHMPQFSAIWYSFWP